MNGCTSATVFLFIAQFKMAATAIHNMYKNSFSFTDLDSAKFHSFVNPLTAELIPLIKKSEEKILMCKIPEKCKNICK